MSTYQEWAAAKVMQAHAAIDTYGRVHAPDCHRWHLDCAQAEIARLRRLLADGRAGYADIHPEDAA